VTIRILIADDHDVVRQGLRTLLELDAQLKVIGEAADGAEAIEQVRQLRPDVVLMDLLMPGMDGLTATEHIRRELRETEVVALTSVLEAGSLLGAIRAGAIACVVKDTNAHDLRRTIKAAAAGQVQLTPKLAERLLRDLRLYAPTALTIDATERRILQMLAAGCTTSEMARAMGIDESATRTRVDALLNRLFLRSRTQAVLYAAQAGLVVLDALALNGTCTYT
jgi:DNA-binding NarL/FixJ family response regulator